VPRRNPHDRLRVASDVVERLDQLAGIQPDSPACIFLPDGEQEGSRWTYLELRRRIHAVGEMLRQNAAPGDRAVLLYPAGLDFIAAFFGCLYAARDRRAVSACRDPTGPRPECRRSFRMRLHVGFWPRPVCAVR